MNNKRSPLVRSLTSLGFDAILVLIALLAVVVDSGFAQVQAFPNTPDMELTTHTTRHRAPPDECWSALTNPSQLPMYSDPANCAQYATNPPAKPKVNQSYIWGITETGDNIWYGTFANGNCVTQAGSTPANNGNPNGSPNAYAVPSWVCEYYDSPYYPRLYPNALIGDARSPRIYRYTKSTHALVDQTPRYINFVDPLLNPEGIFTPLVQTRGIRAAATYNNIVILAGPNLSPAQGLTFFGWDATTGAFLGAVKALGFNNIRQFLNLNGVLYSGVGTNDSAGKITGGAIIRLNPSIMPNCTWNPGNSNAACWVLNGGTPQAPVPPTIVGALNTVSGTLTSHNGRIFTATWPAANDLPGLNSSLYMSPVVPDGGLTSANAGQWQILWKASDYEPDPSIALSYAGGGIASFDGYLWWGTLHIPMSVFQRLVIAYPPTTQDEVLQDLAGTFRATVFFRIKDPDTNPKIDIVYGNSELPVFTPPTDGSTSGTWTLQENNMHKKSLWGTSGFGNIWNTYTWSARVWNNRLWVGTMDWSFTAEQGTELLSSMNGNQFPPDMFDNATFGADLFYFTSADKPAFAESTNGVDNPMTFGVRNQLASTNGNLFLGMANAMNLVTTPADAAVFGGLGGWELDELTPRTDLNTPAGSSVPVNLSNGYGITFCNVTSAGMTFSSTVPNPYDSTKRFWPLFAPYNLSGPLLPPSVLKPASVTLLWSSAVWGQGCSPLSQATVAAPVPAGVTNPRLLQMQWDGAQLAWKDITTSVDPTGMKVYGAITRDYLGALAVSSASPPLSVSVTNKGMDPTKGSYFVDLTILNSSIHSVSSIALDSLSFVTLGGTGTISYNTAIGQPLPQPLPNLAPGASTTYRLYLKSNTAFGRGGVTRFAVTENFRMTDSNGALFSTPYTENVIP